MVNSLPVRVLKCLRITYSKKWVCKPVMPCQTGASGGAAKQKMINDAHDESTPAKWQTIADPDQGEIPVGIYHTVRQHSKLPRQRRQRTVATASKHRQTKAGRHESGRIYHRAAAATGRYQPAALLFVVVGRSSINSGIIATEQQQHNTRHGAASITGCSMYLA